MLVYYVYTILFKYFIILYLKSKAKQSEWLYQACTTHSYTTSTLTCSRIIEQGDGWKLLTHHCPQLEHVCCACCAFITADWSWSWSTPVATAEAFNVGKKTHSIILYINLCSIKLGMLTNSYVHNETAVSFWDIDLVRATVRLLHWGDPQRHEPSAQVLMDEGRPVYVLIHLVAMMVVSMSICMHHTFVTSSLHVHGVER